ncbi:MAG: CBS domain-containing protein, partial [Pseudomonadota bacterium]
MGDTTGSSTAAQSAQQSEQGQTAQTKGPTRSWIARLFGRGAAAAPDTSSPSTAPVASREASARRLLVNLRNMQTLTVQDVMVPRADIHAIAQDTPLEEIVETYRETTLTRLPVFNETLDDPIGFLHLKDFALNHGFEGQDAPFDILPMVRPVLYVPPSMPIDGLLQRMQSSRSHIALVIDEYGGVDGLVTIEDLLEQVVGDIEDEHDEVDPIPWREETKGVYLATARAELEELEQAIGVTLLDAEDRE